MTLSQKRRLDKLLDELESAARAMGPTGGPRELTERVDRLCDARAAVRVFAAELEAKAYANGSL